MRRLAALTFQTLDGVMQAPASPDEDTSGGFQHGGWAAPYWGDVMEQVMREAMSEPYDLLLGRKTYESFAAHWPSVADNPVAEVLNKAKKYVVTKSLTELKWNNSVAITGDLVTEIPQLKSEDGPLLQIHGSWQLIQHLLEAEEIDELRVWTFPVTVGQGKRLFGETVGLSGWSLNKSRTTQSGVSMSILHRVRPDAVLQRDEV